MQNEKTDKKVMSTPWKTVNVVVLLLVVFLWVQLSFAQEINYLFVGGTIAFFVLIIYMIIKGMRNAAQKKK